MQAKLSTLIVSDLPSSSSLSRYYSVVVSWFVWPSCDSPPRVGWSEWLLLFCSCLKNTKFCVCRVCEFFCQVERKHFSGEMTRLHVISNSFHGIHSASFPAVFFSPLLATLVFFFFLSLGRNRFFWTIILIRQIRKILINVHFHLVNHHHRHSPPARLPLLPPPPPPPLCQ